MQDYLFIEFLEGKLTSSELFNKIFPRQKGEKNPDLKDVLTQSLAYAALEIPDIFGMGLELPFNERSLRTAKEKFLGNNTFNLGKIEKIIAQINYEKGFYDDASDVLLASAIYGHNMRNLHAALKDDYSRIEDGSMACETDLASNYFGRLASFRLFLFTMAYLASNGEDKQFYSAFPSSQGWALLKSNFCNNAEIDYYDYHKGLLTNPQHFALCEFIENANSRVNVAVSQRNGYKRISVKDFREGILDKEGKPLPLEKIAGIFEGQSTRHGGKGLCIVRRLSELEKGFVRVFTKTEGNPVIEYNTQTGIAGYASFDMDKGTIFSYIAPI